MKFWLNLRVQLEGLRQPPVAVTEHYCGYTSVITIVDGKHQSFVIVLHKERICPVPTYLHIQVCNDNMNSVYIMFGW